MFFFSSLFTFLKEDTVILTANKRLAVRIFDEHLKMKSRGSITVLSLDDYVTKVWEQYKDKYSDKRILLNVHQEYILWESILNSFNKNDFFQVSSLTYLAKKTWKLFKDFNVSLDALKAYETSEVKHFLRWSYGFIEKCNKFGFMDHSSLIENLIKLYSDGLLNIPKHIVLVGFLEFTPLEKLFFECLENLGCVIDCYCDYKKEVCDAKYVECENSESEIYTMAEWAKNIIETCKKEPFVVCVIPNLNQIKNEVRRIFSEVLNNNFNISSGNLLIEEPSIYAAFEVLRFKKIKISVEDLGYLLRSPFIFDYVNDFSERALVDSKINNIGCNRFGLSYFISILRENDCLIARLKEFKSISVDEKRLPSEWVEIFLKELEVINWSKSRELTDIEIQIVERFHKLLKEFANLDVFKRPLSYLKALSWLRKMACQTVFQPKTYEQAKVQVLGLLEASGQPCTHIWVMGLDNQHFPAIFEPNQLLPRSLQNKYNMPHANADRELYFSKLIMNQILKDSDQVIFSYSMQDGDQYLQESLLIKKFPKVDIVQVSLSNLTNHALKMLGTKKTVNFEEDSMIPVNHDEIINGGSNIFKDQALCPFRAFAKFRMHVKPLFIDREKLYALDRGRFVHKILEIFWKKIKSQEKLLSLSNDELIYVVKECIEKSVFSKKRECKKLTQIEKICLEKLIMSWLKEEKKREKPFYVVSLEKIVESFVSDLKIKMRIDRIDKTFDGKYELIDYKTGKASIRSCFGDRLEEPQLPLYALFCGMPISSVSFAEVRVDEMKFKKLEISLTQLEEWKKTLEKLAEDFCSGDAKVDPKNGSKTCKYCYFKSLCRIEDTLNDVHNNDDYISKDC